MYVWNVIEWAEVVKYEPHEINWRVNWSGTKDEIEGRERVEQGQDEMGIEVLRFRRVQRESGNRYKLTYFHSHDINT